MRQLLASIYITCTVPAFQERRTHGQRPLSRMLLYACLLALAGAACGDPVTVKNSWNGGFEGEFSIPINKAQNGWTLELTFSSAPAALEVSAAPRGAEQLEAILRALETQNCATAPLHPRNGMRLYEQALAPFLIKRNARHNLGIIQK